MASTDPFHHITLTEDDVPGAKFAYPIVGSHSNTQFKRWLLCRGLPVSGNRSKLLERVEKCLKAGDRDISIAIDGGKWYQLKIQQITSTASTSTSHQPPLAPITGWNKFPSTSLPPYFNEGHLHHYVVESVQFIGVADVDDDIDDLHTSKPLSRGKQLFNSGHVQNLKDVKAKNHYFVKSSVMSSYKVDVFYDVCTSLSCTTGFVSDAVCTCVASGMGRCSHVAAVLYALLDYIEKFGCDPVSCISLPCQWNSGRKRCKNPEKIFDTTYHGIKSKQIDNVINYDPCPSCFQSIAGSTTSQDSASHLLRELQHLPGSTSMWETLLKYKYDDYQPDDMHYSILRKQRSILLENLSVCTAVPYEIVKEQGSDEWFSERCIRITASVCKSVSTVKDAYVSGVLYNIMWRERNHGNAFQSVLYGKNMEATAFAEYLKLKQEICQCPGFSASTTGMWVNPHHLQSNFASMSFEGQLLKCYNFVIMADKGMGSSDLKSPCNEHQFYVKVISRSNCKML